MRQVTVTAMTRRAVVTGRQQNPILAHADARHAGPIGAGRDRAAADLWTEAKRLWLAGSYQSGR